MARSGSSESRRLTYSAAVYSGSTRVLKRMLGNQLMDGVAHAQDPNEDSIKVMFSLAAALEAQVFSEKAKPYESVSEWEVRTRSYRSQRESREREYRRARRWRLVRGSPLALR